MSKKFFDEMAPEAAGVKREWIDQFLNRLENGEIALHSFIMMRHDRILSEVYYAPYGREVSHRMFSVTKSMVSLAIGLLAEEGKLSLEDRIVDYFADKLPEEGAHPYLQMLTIRDMLRMASPQAKTTYKVMQLEDWTKTFFAVEPNHVPGTCFAYDTSSTHTLGALVERLTGMQLLDYLRSRAFDQIGFGKEAYVLKDPAGVSMGGSGLVCTPYDMLRVMNLVSHEGTFEGEQLLPKDYIRQAVQQQIPTYTKAGTAEESYGYGYQIWRVSHNGYAFFGMGGQLAIYLPEKDITFITTADAQSRKEGVQQIYDALWEEIYDKVDAEKAADSQNAKDRKSAADSQNAKDEACAIASREAYCPARSLMTAPAGRWQADGNTRNAVPNLQAQVNGTVYHLDENANGFASVKLVFDTDTAGRLEYVNRTGTHSISFGIGKNVIQQFPDYDYRVAVSGSWLAENTFLLWVQIIDSCVGAIYMQLDFKEKYVTLLMRKIEETMFGEYDGFISGTAED